MRLHLLLLLSTALAASPMLAQQPSVSYALQACAAFTPGGDAIEATVTSAEIVLAVSDFRGKETESRQALPVGNHQPDRGSDCNIVVDHDGDQAAIVVPYESTIVDGAIVGQRIVLVRLDLSPESWHRPVVLEPSAEDAGRYLKTSAIIGYFRESKNLVLARSTGHIELLNENDTIVPDNDSYRSIEYPMQGFFLGIDAANNRRWSDCPYREASRQLAPCSLKSVALLGELQAGPEVKPTHGIPQWQGPRFYLFPNTSTLVFGGSPGRLFSRNVTLWVADLSNGSVRERGFPGHLHDDDLTGRSAISPDGKAVAFGVSMSTLAPPFLVDNYSSRGERLLLVDVETLKTIADVEPPHDDRPFGIAVDHRDGGTTLLVNWEGRWERKQFTDK